MIAVSRWPIWLVCLTSWWALACGGRAKVDDDHDPAEVDAAVFSGMDAEVDAEVDAEGNETAAACAAELAELQASQAPGWQVVEAGEVWMGERRIVIDHRLAVQRTDVLDASPEALVEAARSLEILLGDDPSFFSLTPRDDGQLGFTQAVIEANHQARLHQRDPCYAFTACPGALAPCVLMTEAAGGLARCDGERLPTGDEWTWLLAVNEDADALAWRTLAEPAADGDRRLHHLRDGVIEWTFDPGHQVRLGDWGDESAYLQTRATEGATLRGRASGEDWVVDPTVDRWAGDLERPWAGAHLVRSLGPGPAACRKTRRVQLEPLVDAGTWCLPANEVPTGWFLVPPGRYTMPDLRPDGMPMTRTVELAEGLLVADAEVSIAVWEGTDFSEAAPMTMWGAHFPFEDPLLPAIGYLVDQLTYVNQLSRREDLPQCYQFIPCPAQTSGFGCASIDTSGPGCLGYRLPTEDEWRAIAAFLVARNPGTSPAEGAQLLRTHPDVYFRRAGVPGAVLFDVFGNVSEALWPIDPETRALVPVISDNPAAPDLVQNFKRPPANRALPGVDDLFELRPCSTHLFADVKCLQGLRPVRSVMCHGPPRPDIP